MFGGTFSAGAATIATGTSLTYRSLKTTHRGQFTDIHWDLGHWPPLTKRNRRQLADPAHPPSTLVVEAIWDRDVEASARRPLLGLMRLSLLLSIFNLTLLATTLRDLSQFEMAELDSTDKRAIAPPPMPLLSISLSPVDTELYIQRQIWQIRSTYPEFIRHFCAITPRLTELIFNF